MLKSTGFESSFSLASRDFQLGFAQGEEQLLSVCTGRKVDEMRFEQLFLALLEIEPIQIGIGIAVGTGRFEARPGLSSRKVEQGAIRADDETLIVAFRDGNRHKALREPGQINPRGFDRLVGLVIVAALILSLRVIFGFRVGLGRILVFVFVLFLVLVLVAVLLPLASSSPLFGGKGECPAADSTAA